MPRVRAFMDGLAPEERARIAFVVVYITEAHAAGRSVWSCRWARMRSRTRSMSERHQSPIC